MQDSLTFLYDLILGVGGSYLGLSFMIGVVDLWKRSSPDYAGRATEEVASETASETASEMAIEETPVPLELPATSAMKLETISAKPKQAIALPELVTQEEEEERELEPVELIDELEAPAPPNQLEM